MKTGLVCRSKHLTGMWGAWGSPNSRLSLRTPLCVEGPPRTPLLRRELRRPEQPLQGMSWCGDHRLVFFPPSQPLELGNTLMGI